MHWIISLFPNQFIKLAQEYKVSRDFTINDKVFELEVSLGKKMSVFP